MFLNTPQNFQTQIAMCEPQLIQQQANETRDEGESQKGKSDENKQNTDEEFYQNMQKMIESQVVDFSIWLRKTLFSQNKVLSSDHSSNAKEISKTNDVNHRFLESIYRNCSKERSPSEKKQQQTVPYRPMPKSLLHGTSSVDEHYERIKITIELAKGKSGQEGLRAMGLDYRSVSHQPHNNTQTNEQSVQLNGQNINTTVMDSNVALPDTQTRLFHIESDTIITLENRLVYIADGEMYEEVARLCQEYVHDFIQKEASLHWVSICEDESKGVPIRALVHHEYLTRFSSEEMDASSSRKCKQCVLPNTLLITTGKGKVRAGIFSRKHLIISSIEESTCLPSVREAINRGMKVVIIDPNARGDRNGMVTYEQSLNKIFGTNVEESVTIPQPTLHILVHSASGAQLARYLMNKGNYLMNSLSAIAFTDSTHNVQWLKNHNDLSSFLQSPCCLYIRRSNDWGTRKPGEVCQTDQFWEHRFGKIHTIWAGTTDHSLTNWTAHHCIWEHFDKHLGTK